MGIRIKNVDGRSKLKRDQIPFCFGSSATGAKAGLVVMPHAGYVEKIKIALGHGVSATAGDAFHLVVSDPLGSKTIIDHTVTGAAGGDVLVANTPYVYSASTAYNLTQGTVISINASASSVFGPLAGCLIINVNSTLEK
jgi:hypothetical protein